MTAELESSVLNIILSHQPARAVEKMLAWWKQHVPLEHILIAHGGDKSEFDAISHDLKIFVDDPRLRTSDHQREMQSYAKLFQAGAEYLKAHQLKFEFIHFAEYDHVPLVADLNKLQIAGMEAERADVIGFHLHRVDNTSNAHFLYHASNEKFAPYWSAITRRTNSRVILSMFGSGSFWTREAFFAVAAVEEPFPIYMEIFLPTLAHHLGFRVRDFGAQNKFIGVLKDKTDEIEKARTRGAWTLHPVKYLWN